jgi:hypothetical protein
MIAPSPPPGKKMTAQIIVTAGLLVGTLDILSAFVDYYIGTGKNPLNVLPYIASGIFGKAALPGGAGMMVAGLLLHYLIAFLFTIFFFWLYSKINILSANCILTGILYGLFIWIVMNLVVVQLSNAPHNPVSAMKFSRALKALLIIIFMIGLPLSFMARYYSKRNAQKESAGT